MKNNAIENAQISYCALQNREHRKATGQFFTPRWIADGMAKWVVACQPDHIIDPAVGFGILLDACRSQGFTGKLEGYEVDRDILDNWTEALNSNLAAELHHQDFLTTVEKPIEAAIVNPPYNRFQNRNLSQNLLCELNQRIGLTASGYTNQYALFLYLVVSRLKMNGRAAFIVPSEFLATGYGVQVKDFLCRNKRLHHLILFDTDERIFPEAATTACVLLFDGLEQKELLVWHLSGEKDSQRFLSLCAGNNAQTPNDKISYYLLSPEKNWQNLGYKSHDMGGMMPLAFFGNVKRGIATGANEFFLLNKSEAEHRSIPSKNLVKCIASASSASNSIFDDVQVMNLINDDQPCYLFDGVIADSEPVRKYLAYGQEQGINHRYLTRTRKPWYRLEYRRPAALLLAVFGRDGFRVCLNRTNALNLTAYHGFYPRPGMEKWTPLIWLYFQGAMAHTRFSTQHRAYGDGLKKLEPGDWSKLSVPDWMSWPKHHQDFALNLVQLVLSKSSSTMLAGLKEACNELDSLVLELLPMHKSKITEIQLSLLSAN